MPAQLKSALLANTLTGLLLVSLLNVAALADEGGLIIPSQANDPVELTPIESYFERSSTEYSDLFQVFVGNAEDCCANKAPIVGRYESDNKSVKFIPRFDFVEGQDYVVRVMQQDEKNSDFIKLTRFNIQSDSALIKAEVTSIYPSGDSLPENVLRFYIHFSTPMKPHVAFNYIKLVDAFGNIDDAAFMKFKQELWSEDRKRLTVLMDPGRIKRMVSTNLRLGPALHEGKRYQLVVDSGWPTANGNERLAGFSKSFYVSKALRELPNVEHWRISIPAIHTKGMLKIELDSPFDHQLLHTNIKVFSVDGEKILGKVVVGKHETEWAFHPNQAWLDKQVFLVIDSELEDVAGNNFRDLLDHSIEVETKKLSHISIPLKLTAVASTYLGKSLDHQPL